MNGHVMFTNEKGFNTDFKIFINVVQNKLTPKELTVFKCLLSGMSVSDITEKMNISYKTISTHKISIYRKLNVKNDLVFFRNMILLGVVTYN